MFKTFNLHECTEIFYFSIIKLQYMLKKSAKNIRIIYVTLAQ